jgi:hypothetical protein
MSNCWSKRMRLQRKMLADVLKDEGFEVICDR